MGQIEQFDPRQKPIYPRASISLYGPDGRNTVKVVVRVHTELSPTVPTQSREWLGSHILSDPVFMSELKAFLMQHAVRQTVISEGNIGCVHEEGVDYPKGEDCPFCPFWKGKRNGRRPAPHGTAGDEGRKAGCPPKQG
ncbi:MAG: hypothetical protein JXR37_13215 [Kiritimatiellae bacterium]|nr:hypothetical protein [Kiritimatiellia bacterium]